MGDPIYPPVFWSDLKQQFWVNNNDGTLSWFNTERDARQHWLNSQGGSQC